MHSVSKRVRLSEPRHENLNEGRPILSTTKMYSITLLSGNIRFMRMLAVVLEIYVNFESSSDLRMPAPICTGMVYRTLFQVHVDGL